MPEGGDQPWLEKEGIGGGTSEDGTMSATVPELIGPWECCLMCLCCFVSFLALPYAAYYLFPAKEHTACRTPGCIEFGKLLFETVNSSLNPCDNFYKYVCNGWDSKHEDSVKTLHRAEFISSLLKYPMTTAVPPQHQDAHERASQFYKSCIEVALKNRSEVSDLKTLFRESNITWPVLLSGVDLLQVMGHISRLWDVSPLLDVSTVPLPRAVTGVRIKPGKFITVWENTRQRLIQQHRYYDYFAKIYEFSTGFLPSQKDFELHVETEDAIMQKVVPALENLGSVVLSEEEFLNRSKAFQYARWKAFLEKMGISMETQVMYSVTNLCFFEAFNEATLDVKEPVMVLFLGWGVFFELEHIFVSDVAALLYNTKSELVYNLHYECFVHVERYMSMALSLPAVKIMIPSEAFSSARNISNQILERLTYHLSRKRFIGYNYTAFYQDKLWKEAQRRFDRIIDPEQLNRVYEGYPDMGKLFWENHLSVVAAWRKRPFYERIYESSLLEVEDHYSLRTPENDVIVWPYLLTAPFFAVEITKALQFGSLGSLLVAAMGGDLFEEVYSELSLPDKAFFKRLLDCFNGSREHVPDDAFYKMVTGNVLWEAFHSATGGDRELKNVAVDPVFDPQSYIPTQDTPVEGLPMFSADQVFFITLCYLQCSGSEDKYEDVCNAVARNTVYFAMAFNCTVGSRMNPKEKCKQF
ncbi:endothelin-converting enzyme 2-like isoform X2 [Ornithodoros turicata]|uniref:endothelin-converting enzyme 2-like isoform X2 n=1 Tax=Ornithodoros turicata TaxID=34597 RepID=UPI00313A4BC2